MGFEKWRLLDLFSGIGGFSLGLERSGNFETVAFCEIESYCQKVLRKHWPNVPIHDDVTTMQFEQGQADAICAGFPCQDISNAGKRAGITGERSGLWREVVRAVRVVRPLYVFLENVAAILGRGLGTVLGDLAESGYDAEWDCIPASAIGARHRRDRWWCIAYPRSLRRNARGAEQPLQGFGPFSQVPYPNKQGPQGGLQRSIPSHQAKESTTRRGKALADAESTRFASCYVGSREVELGRRDCGVPQWAVEPNVGRVANGVSSYVDRLTALGNAVVPQIPQIIGTAIGPKP